MSFIKELEKSIQKREAKICVMGLGYVGLPTALHFATSGFSVFGFDIDKKKIKTLNENKLPFYDVGLEENLEKALASKNITFHDNTECIKECDFVLVIVPTPVNAQKVPDLSYIINAGEMIAKNLKENQIIVLESTVYPGVTEEILGVTIAKISKKKPGVDFHLAYVPERYNPGDEEHTISNLNRILGADTPETVDILKELYSSISEIEDSVFVVRNTKTAEAAKVIENTQRNLNIALMNEIALICELLGIDSIEVIEAAATKWNFIKYFPGAGVGGHCLPHDPYYLTTKAKELGYNPEIILAGRRLNDWMPFHMTDLIQSGLNQIEKPVKGTKIIVLGAAYKENTGDLRSAPSEIVIKNLIKRGANVLLIDPNIITDEKKLWGAKLFKKVEDAPVENTSAVVLMTAHKEFSTDFLIKLKAKLAKEVVLVDGRRKVEYEKIKEKYFYIPIGSGLDYNL